MRTTLDEPERGTVLGKKAEFSVQGGRFVEN